MPPSLRRLLPLCLAAVIAAWPLRPAQAEEVTSFTLENGLEVVVIEDHRAPIAVQMVWYKVGAADEPQGKSGIAHFLEHLMFKGTEKIAPGTFSKLIEEQGGDDNAFTSWDYTAYFQRIAADRLDLVMEMEADRMRNLRLTPDIVATEREVILEERAERTDSDPGSLLSEQMRAAQYLNGPYGVPIIGWRPEIEQLNREDALAYYSRFYAPNNAILIVAGDVTPEGVKALAEKHYGPIPPSEGLAPRLRPQEPEQLAERRLVLSDPRVSNPYLYRTYLAPERDPGNQKDAAALAILAELLGGDAQTSVLARALTFDRQVAVYASAYYDGASIDDTTFGVYVVPAPGISLTVAEAALDEAIQSFLDQGPDPAAFERVRTRIRAAEIYGKDDVQGLASMYGEELAIGLTLDDIRGYDEVLLAVTPDDVRAIAAKVLDRRRAVTGWLTLPEGEAADANAPPPQPVPQEVQE